MCSVFGCGHSDDKRPLPQISASERRHFLKGAIALPLATVLAWPDLASAAANMTSPVSVPLPDGGKVDGVIALPENRPAPVVLLVHEWWGLNDQIKSVAVEFAKQGYMAVAVDLYDGEVTTSTSRASRLMKELDEEKASRQIKAMADWARAHKDSTGKIGTVGWCFGGGWSLNCSLLTPVDATVIYYGHVKRSAQQLTALKGPVLGHFATKDDWITREMVEGFEREMKKAGKTDLTVHWYEADHAFANPSSARYDQKDAILAWQRTLDFYKKQLG